MLVTACQDRKYQYPDSSVREELGNFTKKKKMEVSNYTPQKLVDFFLSKSSEWRLLENVQNCVCGRDKKQACQQRFVFYLLENFFVQVYMIHGKKKLLRLAVLLVTTTSFRNFTHFEISKLLELTGQNENAFLSKQMKVTFGNLNHYFRVIL